MTAPRALPGGLFVTLEGGEGSGKSTQMRAIERALSPSFTVLTCREPGGTWLGERVRSTLFDNRDDRIVPLAELLLFAAARAQLVEELIRPALADGAIVISDRFADSTTAYQQYGRELDTDTIARINETATGGLLPALTILLDIDPDVGLRRGSRTDDYLEREDLAFHRQVRRGYLELAAAEPERWLVLDGTRPEQQITHAILVRLRELTDRQP